MSNTNEYMRKYLLNRYHKRRTDAINKLGGCCKKCNSKENLEIDHIDPKKKKFNISVSWSTNINKINLELEKCQLLCKKCHIEKTRIDKNQKSAKNTHGTLSSFRYCKCPLCREAKNSYMRQWKTRNKFKKHT